MKYRVPYRVHSPRGKTKASIDYIIVAGDLTHPQPGPRAKIVEFEASSHRIAQVRLQELIVPGDCREVMGRTNVRLFTVREP